MNINNAKCICDSHGIFSFYNTRNWFNSKSGVFVCLKSNVMQLHRMETRPILQSISIFHDISDASLIRRRSEPRDVFSIAVTSLVSTISNHNKHRSGNRSVSWSTRVTRFL